MTTRNMVIDKTDGAVGRAIWNGRTAVGTALTSAMAGTKLDWVGGDLSGVVRGATYGAVHSAMRDVIQEMAP